jgi:hypothetical protein
MTEHAETTDQPREDLLALIGEHRDRLARMVARAPANDVVHYADVGLEAHALAEEIVAARRLPEHPVRYRVRDRAVRTAVMRALASSGYDAVEFIETV